MKTNTLLLVIVCLLCSFSGGEKPFNNASKWIPADFDTRNNTLLLQSFSIKENPNAYLKKAQDKVNEEMKAEMQTAYPYKWEFVTADDVKNNHKYADKDKYRWVLIVANVHTQSVGSGGASSSYSNDFHIYDRKSDKHYDETKHPSSSVLPVMKPTLATIVQHLKGLTSPPASQPSANPH